jgi:hypothetical protein
MTAPWLSFCELCARLSPFLAARDQTTMEWPLAAHKRSHIYGILDRHDPSRHAYDPAQGQPILPSRSPKRMPCSSATQANAPRVNVDCRR